MFSMDIEATNLFSVEFMGCPTAASTCIIFSADLHQFQPSIMPESTKTRASCWLFHSSKIPCSSEVFGDLHGDLGTLDIYWYHILFSRKYKDCPHRNFARHDEKLWKTSVFEFLRTHAHTHTYRERERERDRDTHPHTQADTSWSLQLCHAQLSTTLSHDISAHLKIVASHLIGRWCRMTWACALGVYAWFVTKYDSKGDGLLRLVGHT